MVVYLAALQDIPRELVEAASIDGARRWGVLRHVVLPAAIRSPSSCSCGRRSSRCSCSTSSSSTTRGGPLQSTTVVVLYVWQQAFEFFNAGYAAAAAYVLASALLVVALMAGVYAAAASAGVGVAAPATRRPLPPPRRRGSRWPFNPWHLVLAPIAFVFALPLIWLAAQLVHDNAQINRFPPTIIPDCAAPRRLPRTSSRTAMFAALVPELDDRAAVDGASNLVFCSLAGYAFARMRFRGSTTLLVLMLATLVVPFQLDDDPDVPGMKQLGLIDTLGALIVPSLVTPFGVFLLRQFFVSLPREIEEAAWIDGCSRLTILCKIVLPLARPALATVAVLTFLLDLERLHLAADRDQLRTSTTRCSSGWRPSRARTARSGRRSWPATCSPRCRC